jgi:hypothetical protein
MFSLTGGILIGGIFVAAAAVSEGSALRAASAGR